MVLVVLGLISFVALPWTLDVPVALIAAFGVALISCVAGLHRLAPKWDAEQAAANFGTPAAMVWMLMATGLLLRLAYLLAVSPVQLSDTADYVMLANRLLADGS